MFFNKRSCQRYGSGCGQSLADHDRGDWFKIVRSDQSEIARSDQSEINRRQSDQSEIDRSSQASKSTGWMPWH